MSKPIVNPLHGSYLLLRLYKSRVCWYLWCLLNSHKGDLYAVGRGGWHRRRQPLITETEHVIHPNSRNPVCPGESAGLLGVVHTFPRTNCWHSRLQLCYGPCGTVRKLATATGSWTCDMWQLMRDEPQGALGVCDWVILCDLTEAVVLDTECTPFPDSPLK